VPRPVVLLGTAQLYIVFFLTKDRRGGGGGGRGVWGRGGKGSMDKSRKPHALPVDCQEKGRVETTNYQFILIYAKVEHGI
jgi:hypothetical protein